MRRSLTILLLLAMANLSTACLATRKFTRNEVKASSDTLNARIDTTDSNVVEVRDSVDRVNTRVTGVDGKVTELDTRTTQRFETVQGEMRTIDQKAVDAQGKAVEAQGAVSMLDQRFQNRNMFTVAGEKTVYFKFDSATVQAEYEAMLDEIAETLTQNPNALLVLEGRTDSTGDKEYNVKLSERRVDAVKRYLAVEKGVPVYRLHFIGLGDARPVSANDSREGREKNRAVTLQILVPRTDPTVASKNN
jgi:outer membrane protein OmpA-like peptidoglycan-associated protein